MDIMHGVSSGYMTAEPKKQRLYKRDFLSEKAFDEVTYLEALNNMTQLMNQINGIAENDGEQIQTLQKYIKQLFPTFTALCGINPEELTQERPEEQQEVAPEQPPELEPEPVKEEPEKVPENFIKEENGWGLCPVCRKKMIKLTDTTKLMDFPAYCKACRSEYLVSWWNVERKEIEYTRYVNKKQYIDRNDIRSEGMKGTGVKGFMRTRTSATERVAISL